eukprot:CAMPEP_0173405362 /NCGR_PEP_ID=MMETSP1356-20130122/61696_1 /TAXON_ID=77927 ORGANISM="Hemiselmis virescens, Strain PCC157" /NCGR_SAMPLE_ID=MMETSP1356 /ASSEMBLY_ACC=CAM_ASM_000847 /LENGTH=73 /DNA_ID=CAMNT_0014366159 /DNA_START=98 /DNA_END=319 /DNA_ORIENTATION=+
MPYGPALLVLKEVRKLTTLPPTPTSHGTASALAICATCATPTKAGNTKKALEIRPSDRGDRMSRAPWVSQKWY